MKSELNYCRYEDCRNCLRTTDRKFRYVELAKGEKFYFEVVDAYAIVFILDGSVEVSCNEYDRRLLQTEEIALWQTNTSYMWNTVTDTVGVVFTGNNAMTICDRKNISERANNWLNSVSEYKSLLAKPRLMEFLHSIKNYLNDGITCPFIHECKEWELTLILKAYYSPEELMNFFLPAICHVHEFESFVMKNYLKMKGVKEFVDLSGMNLSTFNRKFKFYFGESPYQWLIKQRAKHIYRELTTTTKNFSIIAKEFYFTDASHFNHYCKSMFGNPPSKIREQLLVSNEHNL